MKTAIASDIRSRFILQDQQPSRWSRTLRASLVPPSPLTKSRRSRSVGCQYLPDHQARLIINLFGNFPDAPVQESFHRGNANFQHFSNLSETEPLGSQVEAVSLLRRKGLHGSHYSHSLFLVQQALLAVTLRIRSFLAQSPPLAFINRFDNARPFLLIHGQIVGDTEDPSPDVLNTSVLLKRAIQRQKDFLRQFFGIVAITEQSNQITVDWQLEGEE